MEKAIINFAKKKLFTVSCHIIKFQERNDMKNWGNAQHQKFL